MTKQLQTREANPPAGQTPGLPATIDVHDLIMKAVEKNMPVESMEKLLLLRDKLYAEQARHAYNEAMQKFQAECPVIQKKKKVMNKDGRSVRYIYAPLDDIIDQVKDKLAKHGFSYRLGQEIDKPKLSWMTVYCTATHSMGHSETEKFEIPLGTAQFMTMQQEVGAARTFGSRYCFLGVFGIMTGDEDNDAQEMEKTEPAPASSNQQTTKQPEPAKSAAPQQPAAPPAEKPTSAIVSGIVTDKVLGPSKKKWKLVVNGQAYYTFNKNIIDAVDAEAANGPCELTWKEGKFGKDIVTFKFPHVLNRGIAEMADAPSAGEEQQK